MRVARLVSIAAVLSGCTPRERGAPEAAVATASPVTAAVSAAGAAVVDAAPRRDAMGESGMARAVADDGSRMIDLEAFNDLFEPFAPISGAFVAKSGISSVTIKDSKGYRTYELRFDESGHLVSSMESDSGGPFRAMRATTKGGLVREQVFERLPQPNQAPPTEAPTTVTLSYDERGRVTERRDARHVATFRYEGERLVEAVNRSADDDSVQATIRYAYGDGGRVASVEIATEHRNIARKYRYDPGGRLVEIVRTGSYMDATDRFPIEYDASGNVTKLSFFENEKLIVEQLYQYDTRGRILSREQRSAVPAMGSDVMSYTYVDRQR